MIEAQFESYKQAYIRYVESQTLNTFVKKKLLDERVFSGDFKFYLFYPKLFSGFFDIEDSEELKYLCLSGFFYYLSLIKMDRIFDSTARFLSIDDYSIVSASQEESAKILGSLFPPRSVFWNLWNQRKAEYLNGMLMERAGSVTDEEAWFNLADYKSAFGKAAIDALHVMSGEQHPEVYRALLHSHRHFSIANQVVDDIQDMIPDLEEGQFNYIHRELVGYLEKHGVNPGELEHEETKKYLYSSKMALQYYRLADEQYQKAIDCLPGTGPSLWGGVLNGVMEKNRTRTDTLAGFYKVNEARAALRQNPPPVPEISVPSLLKTKAGSMNGTLAKSLTYLAEEWQGGFAELQHMMYLSNIEGFTSTEQVHTGDIFQRAIVGEILHELSAAFSVDLGAVIRHETDYLISRRNGDAIGGWKYFPTVPEIAADIDDLGQMIQLLHATGNHAAIQTHCRQAVDVTLEHCADAGGGFKTWILPRENLDELQERQRHFNRTRWGEGPDVEVNANFFYSLLLMDRPAYTSHLQHGCAYIRDSQAPEGYWPSRWYYGNYYGTYVCSRLLKHHGGRGHAAALKRAFDYIADTQQENGGWCGVNQAPDALNTSFCLLALKTINSGNAAKTIQKGEEFLLSQQQPDGSWPAVNFIMPRVNEPYRSKTMTTAVVLRALVGGEIE